MIYFIREDSEVLLIFINDIISDDIDAKKNNYLKVMEVNFIRELNEDILCSIEKKKIIN